LYTDNICWQRRASRYPVTAVILYITDFPQGLLSTRLRQVAVRILFATDVATLQSCIYYLLHLQICESLVVVSVQAFVENVHSLQSVYGNLCDVVLIAGELTVAHGGALR
jgi:hypothetical protein